MQLNESSPGRIAEHVDEFLFHCRLIRGARPSTLRRYTDSLKQFTLEVSDFERPNLYTWAAKQLPSTQSASTMRTHLSILAIFTRWLADKRVISHAPKLNARRRPPTQIELPTQQDLQTLCTSLARHTATATPATRRIYRNHELMIRILVETGIRVGELVALKPRDHLSTAQPPQLHINPGKSISAERNIIVTQELSHAISAHLNRQNYPTIFASRVGKPIPTTWFDTWLTRFQKSLTLSCKLTPHTFRHQYSIKRAQAGDSVFDVMTALGHTHPKQTIFYYNRARRLMPPSKPNSDLDSNETGEL